MEVERKGRRRKKKRKRKEEGERKIYEVIHGGIRLFFW